MSDNADELEVALRNLRAVQKALDALREELQAAHPALFASASRAYRRRIRELQAVINAEVRETQTAGKEGKP